MNRPLFSISVPSRRLRGIQNELRRIADALEREHPPQSATAGYTRIEEGALHQGLSPEAVRERVRQVLVTAQKQGLEIEDLLEGWEPELNAEA